MDLSNMLSIKNQEKVAVKIIKKKELPLKDIKQLIKEIEVYKIFLTS